MLISVWAEVKNIERQILDERPHLTSFTNTEKRVENTTSRGVFLTKFEVFGNEVK